MDLKELKPSDEAQPLDLINPETNTPLVDSEGKQCRVWLYGEDSERMMKRQRDLSAVRANMIQRIGQINITPLQIEKDRIETAVAVTDRFENVTFGGEPVDKNPERIRDVYREVRWVLEQAERFVGERRNFMKKQSGS